MPPESKPPGLCVAWDSASPELCTTAGWSLQRHDSAPPPGHPGVGAADCAAWQHRLDSAPPGPGFWVTAWSLQRLDSAPPPGLGAAWNWRCLSQQRWDSAPPESRRLVSAGLWIFAPGKIQVVVTQGLPNLRSTDTSPRRRVKELQLPGGGAESRGRQVPRSQRC